MNIKKYVAYFRVSTQQQGRSGLGLEAQRVAVRNYVAGGPWKLMGEFSEIETGKGANALARRPQLLEALTICRKHGATLILAKLDRLARNVHFVSGLLEAGVDFVAVDAPAANKTMLHIFAAMSEWERDQISARTAAALAAAKARGVQLGRTGPTNLRRHLEERRTAADLVAQGLREVLAEMRAEGLSQHQIATRVARRSG